MIHLICDAIALRRVIAFYYDASLRRVEPHQLGYDHDGDLTLSAWQLSGGSGVGWRDFHLANISAPTITADRFAGPRADYSLQNKKMRRILCGL